MHTERQLAAIDEDIDEDEVDTALEPEDHETAEEQMVEHAAHRRSSYLVPSVFALLAMGWTAAFVYANRGSLGTGSTLSEGLALVSGWSMPILLLAVAYLLAARLSRAEARRFGDAANALAMQSDALEARLHSVNRELSLAREFLSSQTLELDSLGRTATDRLSRHADRLQELIVDNGQQVDRIAAVSRSATDNMDRLRNELPVIANSARDVSNKIGAAGHEASSRLNDLAGGFERVDQFGKASERQVDALAARTTEALDGLEARMAALQDASEKRLARIDDETARTGERLEAREVHALAAITGRAEALRREIDRANEEYGASEAGLIEGLNTRFADLRASTAAVSDELRSAQIDASEHWSDALMSLRKRIDATREQIDTLGGRVQEHEARFIDQLTDRREALAREEEAALAALHERLGQLDGALSDSHSVQREHLAELSGRSADLEERIAQVSDRIGVVADAGREAGDALAAKVAAVTRLLEDSGAQIEGTDTAVSDLTDRSVRLLELIHASAKHARDDLPRSIAEFSGTLGDVEERSAGLQQNIADLHERSAAIVSMVAAAEEHAAKGSDDLDTLEARIGKTTTAQIEQLDQLSVRLAELAEQNDAVADHVRRQVSDALDDLDTRSREVLASLGEDHAAGVSGLAGRIADDAGTAIEAAIEKRVGDAIANLAETTERAEATGRNTAIQLRDQLARVNELTSNLETRVERARERAEESVDNDFSRRVALITDSLNSNAIDIGKVLSSDVSDTAWAAYMKGDRGIFTRRAVRLLDNTTARDIAELYDADGDFRENVSRYIHDFEAMLRMLLSTRDGQPLGVTVLGSDVGKLYVALAQAIERLRE